MKRYLMALLGSALLAGTAWAEPAAPAASLPAAPVAAVVDVPAGACPCCVTTRKVCCPEPAIQVKTTTTYSCRCENFCVPKCALFGHGCTDCQDCGKVRTRSVLVIHQHVTECPTIQCVPREVMDETPVGCGHGH